MAQNTRAQVQAETIAYLKNGGYELASGEARFEPLPVAAKTRDDVRKELIAARMSPSMERPSF
jgi:hypothetical protein